MIDTTKERADITVPRQFINVEGFAAVGWQFWAFVIRYYKIHRFFRALVPQPDSKGDGISNSFLQRFIGSNTQKTFKVITLEMDESAVRIQSLQVS